MAMITQEEVAQRFRRVRRERNLSYKQVSELCGVSVSTLHVLELGKHRLTTENLLTVALWLGIDIDPVTVKMETNDTFESIKATLDADESLTPHARNTLFNLLQIAYKGVIGAVCSH